MGKTLLNRLKQTGKKALPFILAANMLNPLNAQQPKKQNKNDWLYHGLEASYIVLNYIDYKTALNAIDNGATELNLLAKPFVENPHNDITFALFKTGATFTTLYYLRKIKEENPKLAYASLTGANLLYGWLAHRSIKLNLSLDLDR